MASTVDPSAISQATQPGTLTVLIDADQYDAALLDDRVRRTNQEATALLERLEREGRNL